MWFGELRQWRGRRVRMPKISSALFGLLIPQPPQISRSLYLSIFLSIPLNLIFLNPHINSSYRSLISTSSSPFSPPSSRYHLPISSVLDLSFYLLFTDGLDKRAYSNMNSLYDWDSDYSFMLNLFGGDVNCSFWSSAQQKSIFILFYVLLYFFKLLNIIIYMEIDINLVFFLK